MKRRATLVLAALALALLTAAPGAGAAGGSRACGSVASVPIHAHRINCREIGSAHYMWWRRTTYRLGATVVLGGVVYGAPTGEGWGSERPQTIFNGGDLSGLISDVHWTSWDGAVARGHGRHSLFKPRGGYYRHPVVAQLKAKRIGTCEGRRAYLKLLIREPRRPGGPLRPWHSWSGPQTICEPYGS